MLVASSRLQCDAVGSCALPTTLCWQAPGRHPTCYLPALGVLQDVPGVAYGTIPNRADGTLLKLIPKSEQRTACCPLLTPTGRVLLVETTTADLPVPACWRRLSTLALHMHASVCLISAHP